MSIQESNINEDTAYNLKVSLLRGGREERVTFKLQIKKTQVWSNVSIKNVQFFREVLRGSKVQVIVSVKEIRKDIMKELRDLTVQKKGSSGLQMRSWIM